MDEDKNTVQQEIAPLNSTEDIQPQPVNKKENKVAAFFKLQSTRKITYTAVFIALAVVLKILSKYMTPPSLQNIISFSLFYLPVIFAGIFLGPLYGFTAGILGDLIGAMIVPIGAYIPLIGIACGLIGFIPGVIFMVRSEKIWGEKFLKLDPYLKLTVSMVLILIICTAGINTYALWDWLCKNRENFFTTFWTYLWIRFPWQALVALINGIIIGGLYPARKYLFRLQPAKEPVKEEVFE